MTHHKHSGKRSRNRMLKRIVTRGQVRYTFYDASGKKEAVGYLYGGKRHSRRLARAIR